MKLHSNRKSYEKRKRLPENGKMKNPKVLAASIAAIVISAVIFCMIIVIGIFGFASDGTKTASENEVSTAEGPFHAWFYWDGATAYDEAGSYEMSAPFVIPEDTGFVPADGMAAVLGGSYTYDEAKGTVKFKNIGKSVKLTVDSNEMKVGLFKKVTLEENVFVEGETIYIPFRGFCEALGYAISYTVVDGGGRLDVFVPDKEADIQVPTAKFTTDKDTYQVGEKVEYTITKESPMGYEIVEEKWENMAVWYFESGEVNISYSVKDYKGNWSEPVSRTITIEGEYSAAEDVPVLSYYYIVEDSSEISKTVKEEKEKKVPDPANPGKTIVKKEKVDKVVKGPYYGDDMVISLDQFEEEMEYLADEGIHTLTVSEYIDYADSGVMPPEKSVLILFVNGYESTYDLAYPVLKEYGLQANIAPEVHAVEERSTLVASVEAEEEGAKDKLAEFDEEQRFPVVTFDQLKEMSDDATFEIGCISYDSNGYGDDSSILAAPVKDETEEDYSKRVNNDVTAALDVLRENLDKDMVPFFVYPHGETSDVLINAVQNAGFKAAFTKGEDGLILPDSNRYLLERMNVTQGMSKYNFRSLF
ncbi:MAG: polysaccharide deacetylase family protein [Firmicutes bacterium]|nr:polysaccharide deacetylase family protein [Bacillota bacterium]